MIKLFYQNNTVFVYRSTDWRILRTSHRIVGILTESSHLKPALPLVLLPEEVVLLLNKDLATLIQYPHLQNAFKESLDNYKQLRDRLLNEEQIYCKEIRRRDLENVIDKIIDGKKKKFNKCGSLKSRKEILEEELVKSSTITEETLVWPIFAESLLNNSEHLTQMPVDCVLKETSSVKCAVYADLWNRGYYVTSGIKFGGDFLVYLGDPIAYHSTYIVRCMETKTNLGASEVAALGRLGNAVKKKAILATLTVEGSVYYITLSWLDI